MEKKMENEMEAGIVFITKLQAIGLTGRIGFQNRGALNQLSSGWKVLPRLSQSLPQSALPRKYRYKGSRFTVQSPVVSKERIQLNPFLYPL